MSTFFKAVRPDGTDFRTGKVHWLPADGAPIPEGGWLVKHLHPGQVGDRYAAGYLSASSVETDCTGFSWPARLLSVEPVGDVWTPHPEVLPHKRAAHTWRACEELPAWRLFGPQGREVAALIEQASHLTSTQMDDLTASRCAALYAALNASRVAARDAALYAALNASRVAALNAARDSALDAARDSARWAALDAARWAALDAARGLLVLDLAPDVAEILLAPWVSVMGRSWEVAA